RGTPPGRGAGGRARPDARQPGGDRRADLRRGGGGAPRAAHRPSGRPRAGRAGRRRRARERSAVPRHSRRAGIDSCRAAGGGLRRSDTVDTVATVDDLAADLAGLLEALGIARAHIVGLSLGGMTAQAFALAYLQRVHRLVLMSTSARMASPADWVERARRVRS